MPVPELSPEIGLQPGAMLDQFRIVRLLGRGGMGAVFEAEDTLLRRSVAIKVLPYQAPADDPRLTRLLREARAVARLDHPNIVRIYHVGNWTGGYYLVLELIPGGDLQAHIAAHRAMPWRDATQAIADACHGLQAAHAAGFLHRDVKPSNLMVDQSNRIKLADFGLVRGGGLTASTVDGIVGTPHFMSPEQCRGETTDERSDLYSLGATYYALLTGRAPFVEETPVQVMFAHCNTPAPDPRQRQPDIPNDCAAVVRKAMAKLPAQRYRNATELLAALQGILGPRERASPSLSKHEGRSRRSALAVVALGVVLLAAIVIAAATWPRGTRHTSRSTNGGPGPDSSNSNAGATNADEPFDPAIPPGGRVIQLGGEVRAVAFSPDGRLFGAGVADRKAGASVWELATGTLVHRLWKDKPVWLLNFAVKDQGVQRCGDDGAEIFHMNNGNNYSYGASTGPIHAIALSKDETMVAYGFRTGDPVGEVRVHEYPGGTSLNELRGSDSPVAQIVFSPFDDTMAAVHENGQVNLWRARQGQQLRAPDRLAQRSVVAFDPKGPRLAIANGNNVRFWDYHDHVWMGMDVPLASNASSLHISPDGRHFATAESDGPISVWRVADRTLVRALGNHVGGALAVAFAPDGRLLASGGADGTARLWDIRSLVGDGK